MNDYISTEIDSFIEDKDETIWICELSNGLTVYQDDDRPGYHHSSWTRLKNYCSINQVNITKMKLKFRSHVKTVGEFANGYFFCKSILHGFGMTRPQYSYIVGEIKNNVLTTTKYVVPELVEVSSETRNQKEYEHCIILCTNQN